MDSPTKMVMEPPYWQKSESYHWFGTPLDYNADYEVRITPRGAMLTEVAVATTNAKVIVGPSYTFHGGNLDKWVAPTTVEEYRFLLTLGCVLGEPGMPPLQEPR